MKENFFLLYVLIHLRSILTYSRKEWVPVLNLRDDLEPYAERVLMLVPVGAEHFETAYLSR